MMLINIASDGKQSADPCRTGAATPNGSHVPTRLTIDARPRVHGLAVEVDHHGIHEHPHGFSPLPGYEGDASQAGDIAPDRDGAANPQARVISAEALGVTIPLDEGLQGMGLGSCAVLVRVEARKANAVAWQKVLTDGAYYGPIPFRSTKRARRLLAPNRFRLAFSPLHATIAI